LYKGVEVKLIAPRDLAMPEASVEAMRVAGHTVTVHEDLEANIGGVDILYSTRIQEERFTSQEEANLYRGKYCLNQRVYEQYCENYTVIMHPLPRDSRQEANELDVDLNDNPNLAIFRQADNGVLIRMALFAQVLDVVEQVNDSARDVKWFTGSRSRSLSGDA
jgi:aspartate carbamoyltransferase catalytic subunit